MEKCVLLGRPFLYNVLKRVGVEQPEAVQEQRNVASTIVFNMAGLALQEQNYETAECFYHEAILHNSDHYEVINCSLYYHPYYSVVILLVSLGTSQAVYVSGELEAS